MGRLPGAGRKKKSNLQRKLTGAGKDRNWTPASRYQELKARLDSEKKKLAELDVVLKRDGSFNKTASGYVQQHPAVKMRQRCFDNIMRIEDRLQERPPKPEIDPDDPERDGEFSVWDQFLPASRVVQLYAPEKARRQFIHYRGEAKLKAEFKEKIGGVYPKSPNGRLDLCAMALAVEREQLGTLLYGEITDKDRENWEE